MWFYIIILSLLFGLQKLEYFHIWLVKFDQIHICRQGSKTIWTNPHLIKRFDYIYQRIWRHVTILRFFFENFPHHIKYISLLLSDVSPGHKPGLINQKLHFLVFKVFSLSNILPGVCKGNIRLINFAFHYKVNLQ